MATERADSDGPGEQAGHEPRECMPCRGQGRVISNLGGHPQQVTCPWCQGRGVRLAGVDAQQPWLANESAEHGVDGAGSAAGDGDRPAAADGPAETPSDGA